MDPEVADSARRHGDDDIHHAFRNPVRSFELDDRLVLLIGPARDGRLLEVGVVDGPRIVHAMVARERFLR